VCVLVALSDIEYVSIIADERKSDFDVGINNPYKLVIGLIHRQLSGIVLPKYDCYYVNYSLYRCCSYSGSFCISIISGSYNFFENRLYFSKIIDSRTLILHRTPVVFATDRLKKAEK